MKERKSKEKEGLLIIEELLCVENEEMFCGISSATIFLHTDGHLDVSGVYKDLFLKAAPFPFSQENLLYPKVLRAGPLQRFSEIPSLRLVKKEPYRNLAMAL